MARITLNSIADKLEAIHRDVQELKKTKVDKNTNELVMQQLDERIKDVKKDVENINSYGKWLVLLIGGAIITAILRIIVK
jgi:hypothetical protein